jgi:hypothetical protein
MKRRKKNMGEKERTKVLFSKRGQVTIFIIIALVIIVAGALIYFFYPQIKSGFSVSEQNPRTMIQACMESTIKEQVGIISLRGGSLNPENYILYKGDRVEYLCYTNEDYATCVVQRPLIKPHVEKEIQEAIRAKTKECFDNLKRTYENKGYTVNLKYGESNVELLPRNVEVTFNNSLTLTKGNTEQFSDFKVVLSNNLYELVTIAGSIIGWEAKYGEAETTTYMNYYPYMKVEKMKQTDGTNVYILTDRRDRSSFQFASRSVVWPAGYSSDLG